MILKKQHKNFLDHWLEQKDEWAYQQRPSRVTAGANAWATGAGSSLIIRQGPTWRPQLKDLQQYEWLVMKIFLCRALLDYRCLEGWDLMMHYKLRLRNSHFWYSHLLSSHQNLLLKPTPNELTSGSYYKILLICCNDYERYYSMKKKCHLLIIVACYLLQ